MVDADPGLRRRAAMVAICRGAADGVIDRVASEGARALHTVGGTGEAAARYGEAITGTLPLAFDAMALPDGAERAAAITRLAARVRSVSEQHHIPKLVERGLFAIAIRTGREVVRRGARERGFTPDELEREFVAFAEQLQQGVVDGPG